jgi:hypothetical protein
MYATVDNFIDILKVNFVVWILFSKQIFLLLKNWVTALSNLMFQKNKNWNFL